MRDATEAITESSNQKNSSVEERCSPLLSVRWELLHTGFYLAHGCSLLTRSLMDIVATLLELQRRCQVGKLMCVHMSFLDPKLPLQYLAEQSSKATSWGTGSKLGMLHPYHFSHLLAMESQAMWKHHLAPPLKMNLGRTEPLPEEFFGPFPARSEGYEYRPTRNPRMQLGQTCQKTKEDRFAIRVKAALRQHTNTWYRL